MIKMNDCDDMVQLLCINTTQRTSLLLVHAQARVKVNVCMCEVRANTHLK